MGGVRDLADWAEHQRRNWEAYARTRYRDYFIASHRGWDDHGRWKAQADFDAAIVLHQIDPKRLVEFEVLEIGCGVGRLAQAIAPRVKSYTGIDIAGSMIEEARIRCAELGNARFFLGDGLEVPTPASDRRYDLAFALAVFIHCPRAVIAALITSVSGLLAPAGEFRFQLLADSSDPTGIRPSTEAPIDVRPPPTDGSEPSENELLSLREIEAATRGHSYMGDAFRYDDVEPFLRVVSPAMNARLYRFDPDHTYVDLVRS